MTCKQFISKFHREESGQDMLEYALVTAAVLAAVVTGSASLSGSVYIGQDEANAGTANDTNYRGEVSAILIMSTVTTDENTIFTKLKNMWGL